MRTVSTYTYTTFTDLTISGARTNSKNRARWITRSLPEGERSGEADGASNKPRLREDGEIGTRASASLLRRVAN